jgi:hypothetical protein
MLKNIFLFLLLSFVFTNLFAAAPDMPPAADSANSVKTTAVIKDSASTTRADSVLSKADTVSQKSEFILPEPSLQTEYVPKWYDMFKNIPGNWVKYYNKTFTKEMTPAIIGMTVLTGALIVSDEDSWKMSRRWYEGSKAVVKASDIFVFMGDGLFQFGLSAAFAAYGFTFSDPKALRTASQITEVILTAGGVIQVMKHLTGRESPIVRTVEGGRWDFFPNQIEYHKHVPHYDAFPSGHICTATATLVVIMENYPDVKWIKPLGYTLLGCISTGLITTSIHWWSDIPLGIAIGWSFGKIVANPLDIPIKKDDEEKTKTSLKILPSYSANGPGISLNLSF